MLKRTLVAAVIAVADSGDRYPDPACARHGADPRQVDISAAVIRVFERLGCAAIVHWPALARLESRRRDQGQHQPAPGTPDNKALITPAPT